MTKKQKKILLRIAISAVLLIISYIITQASMPVFAKICIFLVPYGVIGWDVLWKAARNILHGQIFDENFLMSIATIGAFCIGEYPEAVFVMLFYQVGELFQSIAVGKSRKSISDLMDIKSDYANIESDGQLIQVDPSDVHIGDTVIIRPGEKIPLDGIVAEGNSNLNTASLTGESVPKYVEKGSRVISGCVNISGLLKVTVTHEFEDSTVAKILDLVENSASNKAKTENFITRFAKYYTPVVVICAVLLAFVPPIFTGNFTEWVNRALIFLVISCPCALVISVPLSFFGGIGGASKCGILVKGSNYLEILADAETVIFDKTGTLTRGSFKVSSVHPVRLSEVQLLEIAAMAEHYSNHPISQSVKAAFSGTVDPSRLSDMEEIPGHGVCVKIDGIQIYSGNDKLMDKIGIEYTPCQFSGTVIHLSSAKVYLGYILISYEIKPDSAAAIAQLKEAGIKKTVMLSGDRKLTVEETAEKLGIDQVHAELLPADKVEKVEYLLAETSKNGKLIYVGDGINDAPVLARADAGIAMGALGSDAAIEAADIVLMDDSPAKIPLAIKISKKTKTIVMQNIVFALGVKFIVLILGAFGLANMWIAVFADVGVAVIAILNAMRAMIVKK